MSEHASALRLGDSGPAVAHVTGLLRLIGVLDGAADQ